MLHWPQGELMISEEVFSCHDLGRRSASGVRQRRSGLFRISGYTGELATKIIRQYRFQ